MNKEPKIRSIGSVLTAGATNTVYTCPDNFISKVVLLFISNHGGNNKTMTVKWTDSSASTSYFIIGGFVLSANGFLKLDTSYLALYPGDTITVTPEAGATTDATITVEEYYEQGLF